MADSIIPLIHNYCDRWCEKCPYVERCHVGIETYKYDVNPEIKIEDITKAFEESLIQIKTFLEEELSKMGLDPKEVEKNAVEEWPKYLKSQEEARKHPLYETSNTYAKKTHSFLEANYYKVDYPIDDEKNELYETIQWYHTMILAKANRICNSLHDEFDLEDPIQNDKNGTAKVLDRCIKKSMTAWHKLMELQPEHEDECLDSLIVLNKLLLLNQTISPDFMQFIRPGFDEEV